MRRFRSLAGAIGCGLLGLLAARGLAQTPGFQPAVSTAGAPAGTPAGAPAGAEDVTAPYAVTPQAGTWLICAHSYMGPHAPDLARQLTEVIRNKHHMPAYIYNHANAERRRMQEEYERACRAAAERGIPLPAGPTLPGQPGAGPRRRVIRVEEQCAVLIGGPGAGWSTIEDASSFLKKVRGWPLPELHLDPRTGMSPYDMKLTAKPIPGNNKELKVVPDGKPINPFETSFTIHNPTVPQAAREQNKFDPLWTKLNADEDYSLLKCNQAWTLAVKEYQGGAPVVPRSESSAFLDKLFGSHQVGESLSLAGAQAHALAEFLTKLGFKAYVLHTRNSSVVTVGAFRGIDDPEMARTQDRLARFSFKKADGSSAGIDLWQRPMPMEVPHP